MISREKIIRFGERPFVRSVVAVAGGTAASQAILMAFSPIITRLYGAEAFGIQGAFVAVTNIAASVAALSYPVAIVLPESDAEAKKLAYLSIYIGIVMSLLVALTLLLVGQDIFVKLNIEEVFDFIYLIPFVMLFSVAASVMSQWLIRKKAFGLTAKTGVMATLFVSLAKVGFGLLSPSAVALIAINSLGGMLGAVLMFFGVKKSNIKNKLNVPEVGFSLSGVFRSYSDFAVFRTPQVLIGTVSNSIPVIMLSLYFGPKSVAFYAIASVVLAMPANLVGGSVMQVFYPRINDAIRSGEDAVKLIVKTTAALALAGIVPFLVLIVVGPFLFALAFGSEWRTAGVYAQWLSIWLFFQFISKPARAAIPALRLQRGALIFESISMIAKSSGFYLGYAILESEVSAIAVFSMFGIVLDVFLVIWVISKAKTFHFSSKD